MDIMKNMSQEEFDKYITLTLLPEIIDEYGEPTAVITYNNRFFQFAKECSNCGDYILLGEKEKIPNSITKIKNSDARSYIGSLTELEAFDYDEISECECDSSDSMADYYDDEYEEDDEPYDDIDEY